jgi:enediyne biosynthesis protein E4
LSCLSATLAPLRSLVVVGLATAAGLACVGAQEKQPSQPPLYGGKAPAVSSQSQTGSATAGTFAPVLDSEQRPITAGGFVETGPVIFQDISDKSGLSVWHHKMGTPQKAYILETIGSGVALLDYDHDGWLDIYW